MQWYHITLPAAFMDGMQIWFASVMSNVPMHGQAWLCQVTGDGVCSTAFLASKTCVLLMYVA
jgi:hypothetical protein